MSYGRACPLQPPLQRAEGALWKLLRVLDLRLNQTCHEKLSSYFIAVNSLASLTMHSMVQGRYLYLLHPLTQPKSTELTWGRSSGLRRTVTLGQPLYLSELPFLRQGQSSQPKFPHRTVVGPIRMRQQMVMIKPPAQI